MTIFAACGQRDGSDGNADEPIVETISPHAVDMPPSPTPVSDVEALPLPTPVIIPIADSEYRMEGFFYHKTYPVAGGDAYIHLGRFQEDTQAAHDLHISGSYVEFTNVDGGAGGQAMLVVNHSTPGDVVLELLVNGIPHQMRFEATGEWENFVGYATQLIELEPGATNTVRLGGSAINIRYISIHFSVGDLPIYMTQDLSPEWRLAKLNYPRGEPVVYGFDIREFGIEPNTGEDATQAVEAALWALRLAGGGNLYFPEGHYTFNGRLSIPHGVGIVGDWREPSLTDGETVGTVFEVEYGHGQPDLDPFIVMSPNSSVRGISFWYPNQDPSDITPYAPTISMLDKRVWGADSITVQNCSFINSWIAILQEPAGAAMTNVFNIYGTPLKYGVNVDFIVDIGRFYHIYFSPIYWAASGLPNAPAIDTPEYYALLGHLKTHATAIAFGRVDWSFFMYAEIDGYATGVYLRNMADSDSPMIPSETTVGFPNGQMYKYSISNCGIALRIDGAAEAGFSFAFINIADDNGIGVYFHNDPIHRRTGCHVAFYDSFVSGKDTAVQYDGHGRAFFLESEIDGRVNATNGFLYFTNTYFSGDIIAEEGAGAVLFANCDFNGRSFDAAVTNFAGDSVKYSDELIQVNPLPNKPPEFDFTPQGPTREVIYIIEADATGTACAAEDIQYVLDLASVEGGGVVLLPPGEYRLDAPIWVPSGVELSGTITTSRMPFNMGTILKVYFGKGTGGTDPTLLISQEEAPPAAVNLEENSGVRGIVFDYPEQNYTHPHPYPYSIRVLGSDAYVVNVCFRNSFNGLDMMTYKADKHYVEGLLGFAIQNKIRVGGGSVGGRIINTQMNIIIIVNADESKFGSWPNSLLDQIISDGHHVHDAFQAYISENHITNVYGHVEDHLSFGNFSFSGSVGTYFIGEVGKGASGWQISYAADQPTIAMLIENIGETTFINSQLVSLVHGFEDVDNVAMIMTTEEFEGTINMYNTSMWGAAWNSIIAKGGVVNMYNMCIDSAPELITKMDIGDAFVHYVNLGINNRPWRVLARPGANVRADMFSSSQPMETDHIEGVLHFDRLRLN